MTPAGAKRIVVGGVGAAMATTVIAQVRAETIPRPRIIIGGALLIIGLSAMADPAPDLAAAFAGLIAAGGLITQGAAAIDGVNALLDVKETT